MKNKLVAILLGIALVVTLLIPVTVVRAEPNELQERSLEDQTGESTEEIIEEDSSVPIEGQNEEKIEEDSSVSIEGENEEVIDDDSVQMDEQTEEESPVSIEEQTEESVENEEESSNKDLVDLSQYDSQVVKILLYTLEKSDGDTISKSELESIEKIDIEKLQNEARINNNAEFDNITINDFKFLNDLPNLKELDLGNAKWNSFNDLENLPPYLAKVKINGCTFKAIPPQQQVSLELLKRFTFNNASKGASENDNILTITLDDISISSDKREFSIPAIEELDGECEGNALTATIDASEGEWSCNNSTVTLKSEKLESDKITMSIKLSENEIDKIKAVITLNVIVDDSLRGSQTEEQPVENEAPVINATDKSIEVGSYFNPMEGIIAIDAEDGDLTSSVQIVENTVDTNTVGEYKITYSVKDSKESEATKTIKVTVVEKEAIVENIVPIINAEDKTIYVGEKFNPLEGVTATDKDGKDITKNIVVKENSVDPNVVGKYVVIYCVVDKYKVEGTKSINVTVKKADQPINTAPVINAEDRFIELGSKFDPLEDVTASDAEDGNITDRIVVTFTNVNTDTDGVYIVTYKVTDKGGIEVSKTISVTVTKAIEEKNEAPVINASNRVIKINSPFNPLEGVTAYDKEDGDVTSKIKVIENMVDINVKGKYTVTYKVKDSKGLETTKSINVKVEEKSKPINKAPIIYVSNKVIKVGTKFNPYIGVTANDYEDGDITSKVKVIYNTLNTNKIGTYKITYSVKDSVGYRVTKSIYVYVIPSNNTRPIIYADDVIVPLGTKYNPYAMVSAYDKEDGNITGNIKVIYNYVNVYKEGTYKVAYKVTDSMGSSASCVVTIKVKNYNKVVENTTNQEPVLYVNNVSIAKDSKFNPLEWVAAIDKEDGDITNRVRVISNEVNTSVEGVYHVAYEVIDSGGAKVNAAIMVYVKDEAKVKEENKPPIIYASNISIEKGTYFNPLDNVTALDEEEGNLDYKLVVKESNVDVSKKGIYKVTYEVTDSLGETTTKKIEVNVTGRNIYGGRVGTFAVVGGIIFVIVIAGVIVAVVIRKSK